MQNQPKQFTHKEIKDIKPLGQDRKGLKRAVLVLKLSTMFVLISLAIYGAASFYNTHDFRSPIIFQNPIPLKKVEPMASPVASRSAYLVGQAYAEEVKNPYDVKSPKGIAWEIIKDKFGVDQWDAFDAIVQKESGWNPYSVNKSSGACSLAQALPCSKLPCELWDYACQADWMAKYIENRYSTPVQALSFHLEKGWY